MHNYGCSTGPWLCDSVFKQRGNIQIRTSPFTISQRRRNNRSIQTNRKGFRPSIRRRRYPLQPGDVVEFGESRYDVVGVHSYGNYVIIRNGEKKMNISTKKVKLARYGKGLRFSAQFLHTLPHGVSLGAVR